MKLAENMKIVPIASSLDLTTSATNPADSINMKNYHRCTFLINFQALGVAAIYPTVYSGATDGALTSAITFKYAFGGAACLSANADVLATTATSAALTVAHATYDNYMLIIEVDAVQMDTANNEEWLTLAFEDTDTGATGNVSVFAVLTPRYSNASSATALA